MNMHLDCCCVHVWLLMIVPKASSKQSFNLVIPCWPVREPFQSGIPSHGWTYEEEQCISSCYCMQLDHSVLSSFLLQLLFGAINIASLHLNNPMSFCSENYGQTTLYTQRMSDYAWCLFEWDFVIWNIKMVVLYIEYVGLRRCQIMQVSPHLYQTCLQGVMHPY